MKKYFYKTNDGIELSGILEKNNINNDIGVIMCHGIRSDSNERGNFVELYRALNDNGIDNFRFDFRGHGENKLDFIEVSITSMVKDLKTTIEFMQELGYTKIILLGASMGASIASLIDYSKYVNIVGLIFWYPILMYQQSNIFTKENINKAVENGYIEKISRTGKICKLSKELMLESIKYKPSEKLKNNKLTKLFVHGDKDLISFLENSTATSKQSSNSKLVIIKNGTHGFFDNREHFKFMLDKTIEFVKEIIKRY